MKHYQVNTGLKQAISLQKKLAILIEAFVEEMTGTPFEEYNRFKAYDLRMGLTEEKVNGFLAKHEAEWAKIEEELDVKDSQGAKLFIRVFEKINMHLHTSNGKHFIQFDYSKTIGRFWNVLSENSRGIVYSYPDMTILSLPFHKFYNLNERPHTNLQALNLNQPIHIMEKLDGSMIHVFEAHGELYTATRGAISGFEFNETAKKLLLKTVNVDAVRALIQKGYTPIFELLLQEGHENALIVKYEKEELRLIAIRERESGDYVHPTVIPEIAQELGVASAEFYHGMSLMDAIAKQAHVKNMEGWVVYLEDGTMLKVKAEEYMSLLRPKDLEMKLKDKPRLLGQTVFKLMEENKLDDVLSKMGNEQTKEAMEAMEEHISSVKAGLLSEARSLYERHYSTNRGDFARAVLAEKPDKIMQNMVFAMMSGNEIEFKWEHVEPLLNEYV